MFTGLHVKNQLFWSDFNQICSFSTDKPNIQISNFMKIFLRGCELFYVAGQTDMAEAYRNLV